MARQGNKNHNLKFRLGKKALAIHEPQLALKLLREAVEACPAKEPRDLASRLYWLSMALYRIGQNGLAIKALASAQKLSPRSRASQMYKRMTNAYGMQKSSCIEHDDYRAFCSIQLRNYLSNKQNRQFSNRKEAEIVLNIIANTWLDIAAAENPDNFFLLGCNEKIKLFKSVSISFPSYIISKNGTDKLLTINFQTGKEAAEGRCPCGSGLAYNRCCGRLKAPYEKELY